MRADREARAERAEQRGQSRDVARGHPSESEIGAREFGAAERHGTVAIKNLPDDLAAVWTRDAQGNAHKSIVSRAAAEDLADRAEDQGIEVTVSP